MLGSSVCLRFGLGCFVLICLMSAVSVDALWFDALTGLAADIMRKPLESFSLFALKSYLLGHVGGRVTQYRQMMYGNRPYGANMQPLQYSPRQSYINNVHNRQRRSLVEEQLDERVGVNVKESQSSVQFLEIAEKLDVDKCIPRLVCEVMAGYSVTQGGQFEDLVVKVLGDDIPEVKGEQKLFSSIYHYAAFAGKHATSADACEDLFPKCKASESEFHKMADKIFAGFDEDDDDDDDDATNGNDDDNGKAVVSGEQQ